jgi:hypothetical protein
VLQVGASLLSVFLSLISVSTQDLERSFLQNNPRLLHAQFSDRVRLNISLPEPIAFSDQVSSRQAFFFFQNIFSRYATLEFFPEPGFFQTPGHNHFILKARWSFRDNSSNDQFVFQVFFLLQREMAPTGAPGRSSRTDSPGLLAAWKVTEIKAAKI